MTYGVRLRVWGEWALFTRPEMKAERVTYDVVTPSAARGVIEAIYFKPQIRWIITRLHVLRPIRFGSMRRNEVGSKVPSGSVHSAMKAGKGRLGVLIDEDRQQRSAIMLRDVEYVIDARFEVVDPTDADGRALTGMQAAAKHLDQFNRRAKAGQCFHRPYLGTRECACWFEGMAPSEPIASTTAPPDEPAFYGTDAATRDLGFMLHDIDFKNSMAARFYRADMKRGVIEVPPPESEEVRG